MSRSLYQDRILEHYKDPERTGHLDDPDAEAEYENPNCGDETHVEVAVEDGRIADLKHETTGCAIAVAALSIIGDDLVGMETDAVTELDGDWVVDRIGVEPSPTRMKCATLGLETVQRALADRDR